jgi:hypothetical protein
MPNTLMHAIQQLIFDLLVGQVVQTREDQNAHHGLGLER